MTEDNNYENEAINNQEMEENNATPSIEETLIQNTNTFAEVRQKLDDLIKECSKVLVGQEELIELMVACILCDGHVLLEGVPGVAKTLTAKVLAKTIHSDFSRIQFTPDLMPSDIIGTSVFNSKDSNFNFKRGPIFSNIILIDEINRAPAKTQSALFEVMEEKQISYDGHTYQMEFPFLVIATQNPIEQEGTYKLPEAQLDRFLMKIIMDYPDFNNEILILERFKNDTGKEQLEHVNPIINSDEIKHIQERVREVHVEKQMLEYITKIVHETRNNRNVYLGGSPRASLALLRVSKIIAMMSGRDFVIPDDVQYIAPHILNHRIILTPEAEISGMTPKEVITQVIKDIEVPR